MRRIEWVLRTLAASKGQVVLEMELGPRDFLLRLTATA